MIGMKPCGVFFFKKENSQLAKMIAFEYDLYTTGAFFSFIDISIEHRMKKAVFQ